MDVMSCQQTIWALIFRLKGALKNDKKTLVYIGAGLQMLVNDVTKNNRVNNKKRPTPGLHEQLKSLPFVNFQGLVANYP